jgi:LysR family glycine cleavage system transcriptional activator
MFAAELASGELVAPYAASFEDGYGYYLKFHAEDLADPVISTFRTWAIARFGGETAERSVGRQV